MRVRGLVFVLCGISFLTFLTLAAYYKWFNDLILNIISIVVMPLGWFGIWEGFSKIVDPASATLQEEKFYDKLSKAQYRFTYIPAKAEPVPSEKEK